MTKPKRKKKYNWMAGFNLANNPNPDPIRTKPTHSELVMYAKRHNYGKSNMNPGQLRAWYELNRGTDSMIC